MVRSAELLARDGYVRIPSFLPPAAARAIATYLRNESEWHLTTRLGSRNWEASPAEQRSIGLHRIEAMALAENAENDFRYLFDVLKLSKTSRPVQDMRPIDQLAEQWRSPDALGIWSKIFAQQAVAGLRIIATRYRPGHFLTQHDDGEDPMRLAAFTLSFSSGWREEWGGLLHLTDEKGDIERSFVPEFNSLVLFNVPRQHFVSEVVSTAPGPRLTISGWLLREPE